jgi:hypothetical protein
MRKAFVVLAVAAWVASPADAPARTASPRIARTTWTALQGSGHVRLVVAGHGRLVVRVGTTSLPPIAVRGARGRTKTVVLSAAARRAVRGCTSPTRVVITLTARSRLRTRRSVPCPRAAAADLRIALPPALGPEGLSQLDRLPVLTPDVAVAGASSHARDGSNSDNGAYVERDAEGRYVLMEAEGPGAVTRIWMTGPQGNGPQGDPGAFGRIQLFFDGEQTPRIDQPVRDFFAGRTAPFLAPFCGDYTVSGGGNFCNLRIPYARSIRVVTTGAPAYYDLGYETYPAGTPVSSFQPDSPETGRAMANAAALFARSGGDPGILARGEAHAGSATVPAAGRTTLLDVAHGGTLRSIQVAPEPHDDATLRSLWLEARWDGHGTPDVAAPLADLFASGAGERDPAKGLLAGYSPEKHQGYLAFPMPFARAATVELVNRGTAPAKASWTVEESPARFAGIGTTTGYLHATYRSDPATATGVDYTALDAAGAGKVVGLSYTAEGPTSSGSTTFMEGDERVHFDGSRSPAVYGTGTEDIFGGAYYYTKLFTLPDHGATAKEDVGPGTARTSQYRLMLADPWPFRDGVHLGVEHGGGNGEQASIHSVVYWYGTDRPALRQTDAFDVADGAAASAAGYAGASGAPAALTAFFEGDRDGNVSSPTDATYLGSMPPPPGADPMGESVTASGYVHPPGTTLTYRATLDPANHGAVLRRLTDQGTSGQRAEVTVDGRPAGTWLVAGANTSKRWLESDYMLPAALTAGRSQITVALHVLPQGWNDYRYVTLSQL